MSRAGVKWVPVLTVPHLNATFPNDEYGFLEGEAPCFSNKKVRGTAFSVPLFWLRPSLPGLPVAKDHLV